ncbi:MAG: N-acetyl-gamma-glutamyl-phosphate reductase, partial [Oscillospiraceae bacterium]
MAVKVFIDGKEGTTGLKIFERFQNRNDVEILLIDEAKRKDTAERKRLINESDYTFLCLPDVAAIEAVSLVENDRTRIIDASTAHRTNPAWAYGFPELSQAHREKIINSKRVAVPGCYASGFNSLVYPMVKTGLLPKNYPVVCHAVSGYSGAGKSAILQYESDEKPKEFFSPRLYALSQSHKHLPEMQAVPGLALTPIFNPYIDDYFSGMTVSVPLHTKLLNKKAAAHDVHKIFEEYYSDQKFVKVSPFTNEGFIAANFLVGTNILEIFVCGNDDRILLSSRLDNLGKGASGAAVQCMNIMMGIDEG